MENTLKFKERVEIGDLVITVSPEPVKYNKHLIMAYDKTILDSSQGISIANILSQNPILHNEVCQVLYGIDITDLNDDYFFEDLVLDIVNHHIHMSYKGPKALLKKIMKERGLI